MLLSRYVHPLTLPILMSVLLTEEELTKPQGELQRAQIAYYWAVTRVCADLLALCSPCLTLALISSGLCGRGRGLTGASPGPTIAVYL